ncbi:MAG TPA: hypothetical protein ENK84_06970 [Desulfobulbus sp.]|nr:hypothetical protein [Desulfobulbus sp.]
MEMLNRLLDWLYFDVITPLFRVVGWVLSLVFIRPLAWLHTPIWLHVAVLGTITAVFSLQMRHLLGVDEKVARFNAMFAEKRRRQQNLQFIPDKYSREALYRVTDDELNHDFNTYLANHYARYVTVYLLPVFLTLAWLNTVFSDSFLRHAVGIPYVIGVPINRFGIQGLTVTAVFLLSYIVSLMAGFFLKRKLRRKHD